MFKLHNKQQLSGSIHSGHFMVSRLDDDDDENNDVGDDTSESERDNAQSVEIDVNNPDSVADVANNLDSAYRVESPLAKNELVTSWNDLDRPAKRKQKQHQYLTYYTNTSSTFTPLDEAPTSGAGLNGQLSSDSTSAVPMDARIPRAAIKQNSIDKYGTPANLSTTSVISSTALALNVTTSSSTSSSAAAAAVVASTSSMGSHAIVSSYVSDEHGAVKRFCSGHDGLMSPGQLAALQSGVQPATAACGHAHAVTIDTSLTKLLECMSLYYSSKLTSPKWKSFKGLKLRMKYKIRLNNLIWRAWFLQCIRGRRPPGCQFTAPAENEVHKKSETIVLEGKYWKRKEKAIVDEYKKWRIFHSKQKSQPHCFRPSSFDWESRVSSLATSSMMYVPEYNFYPDYDMNLGYPDDLPPILEELDQRVDQREAYYQQQQQSIVMQEQQQQQQEQPTAATNQTSSPTRMIEPPPQHHHQQQQQQQQQMQEQQQQQQQNTMTSALSTHQQLQQHNANMSSLHYEQQQQQQQQLTIQVSTSNQMHQQQQQQHTKLQHQQQHQQALMLKNERSPLMMSNHSPQIISAQQSLNASLANFMPQMAQQQQQPLHNPMQISASLHRPHQAPSFGLDQNPLYQQLQQQQQHSQISPQMSQQQQQQDQSMYMCQDLSSLSSSASGSSFGGSGRREQRRVTHINAEQKRRCNIKNGFETLRSILPSINQNVNVKVSKASMLQKAAVCISQLTAEQKQQMEEQEMLKQQIEQLKQNIRTYQSQLPSSGAVINGRTSSQAREMLQTYVRRRALENWKFWIFSLLIEPLFETYYNTVNTNSLEEALKTIYSWLDQSCGLNSLRRDALESMTRLSKSTNVLTSPQTLPAEAFNAVRYTTPNSQSIINSNASSPSMLTVAITSSASQQQLQQQHNQQQQSQQQLIQAPPATISAAFPSMAAAAAAAITSNTTTSMPIGLMPPRAQHFQQQQQQPPPPHLQHQHLQMQQQQQPHHFQVIQTTSQQEQVQQATTSNSLQPHTIRTVW